MARLSDTKVFLLVEKPSGNVMVLMDEVTGEEIVLNSEEFTNLEKAVTYFRPHM